MPRTSSSQPRSITLTLFLYRCLFILGPATFRRDYEAPALQDFRQCCRVAYQQQGALGVLRLWPGLVSETIFGLLVEDWTEFSGGRTRLMLPTIRRSMIATFGAFMLFLFAYVAFGQTADPAAPFNAVGRVHPEVALAHALIAYSGEIALLALVLGGLPILFLAVKRAMPGGLRSVVKLFLLKPKQTMSLLGAALVMTLCFLGLLFASTYFFGSSSCAAANGCILGQPLWLVVLSFAALIGGITLGLFVVLVLSTALSLAVLRSEFGTRILRLALVPIGILALAMATTTIAATIWTIRLWVDAPQFAASSSGLGNGQTVWVIAIIAAMAVSTIVTVGAFTSGLRASQLHASA